MPYTHRKEGNKNCVYKKDSGAKVGCTKGSVKKYLAALHANTDESVTEANTLKGGKADKLSLQQIADKFKVSVEKIKSQIQKGIGIEMEHTNNKEKATEIATDHISEFPDYYDRLGKMEKKAEKQWELNEGKKFIKHLLRENLESTHIEINEEYGYCVGNVHDDISKIANWFSFRKFDFKKYEKYLKKPVAFLNNIYIDSDKKGMGYGNQLYSEFEEECYSNGAECIVLECDTGNEQNEGFDLKKWYESFDYEVIGVERGYPIMIKYLN
jgi:GNAT superfamily N-acetyltransferase